MQFKYVIVHELTEEAFLRRINEYGKQGYRIVNHYDDANGYKVMMEHSWGA